MATTDDTPLMQQWREAKARHRDALLFFRVGDFYELFHADAEEGARVFATAGSAEKCRACEALGAERAINYREEDFAAVVKEATKAGVDVILDMVGGGYIQRNIKALAPDGRLCYIAFLGGSKAEVDFLPVMLKRLTITGSTLRARDVAFKGAIAANLRQTVWPLIEAGKVKPLIHKTFPLAEAAEAHRLMESSAHIGKIVLTTGRG